MLGDTLQQIGVIFCKLAIALLGAVKDKGGEDALGVEESLLDYGSGKLMHDRDFLI